jgi:hypothetical protein
MADFAKQFLRVPRIAAKYVAELNISDPRVGVCK